MPVFGTVSDGETVRQSFSPNGSTTTFTFTFKCNSSDDVLVYAPLTSTGEPEAALVSGTAYTIAPTGGSYLNGGVVTITPALADTFTVKIVRRIKLSQETSQGAITPTSIVAALDKAIRAIQDAEDRKDRSWHLGESESLTLDMTIPSLINRASSYPFFNASGELTYTASLTPSSSNVSPFMGTVLDDTTALKAMATLQGVSVINITNLTYGAIPDDAIDDTAAIQAALNTLVDGQTLYFPPGKYITSATLTIPDLINLTISAYGATLNNSAAVGDIQMLKRASTFVDSTATVTADVTAGDTTLTVDDATLVSVGDVIFVNSSTVIKDLFLLGETHIVKAASGTTITFYDSFVFEPTAASITVKKIAPLDGFRLLGLKFVPNNPLDWAINMEGLTNFVIDEVNVEPVTLCEHGIILNHIHDGVIQNCFIRDCYRVGQSANYGIDVGGAHVTVQDNKVNGCRHEITAASGQYLSKDIVFQNNKSTGNLGTASFDFHGAVYNGRMEGNVASGGIGAGFYSRSPYPNKIINNTCYTKSGSGIILESDLGTDMYDSIVSGNHLDGGGVAGVGIKCQNDKIHRSMLSNNHISNYTVAGIDMLSGADNVVIEGNIFTDNGSSISVQDGTNVTVQSNLMIGDTVRAMLVSGTSTDVMISNNIIDTTTFGIRFNDSAGAIVKNNFFLNLPSLGAEIQDSSTGTIVTRGNLRQGILEDTEILLSTTTIAFNADATTDLYDVPTGVRCVLTKAIITAGADAGATTTITIGADGAETDFLGTQTLSNLDAEFDAVILQPIPNATPVKQKSYAAETNIEAVVANQSGGATNTLRLYGILY